MKEYPNLPLVEERFRQLILMMDENEYVKPEERNIDIYVHVFLQSFADTSGLFSRPGRFAGQMFEDYYVTVMVETHRELYAVYQGNDFVYSICSPPEEFLEFIKSHNMPTLGDMLAKEYRYHHHLAVAGTQK